MWFTTDKLRVVTVTERRLQILWVSVNHKSRDHAYHTYMYANMHHSLWCPEPVWPSAGMWSEAGNVWAMKACVYAGCSRPSPARGKTDTSTASFALHLSPSPPNPSVWSFLTSSPPRFLLLHKFPFYSSVFPSLCFSLHFISVEVTATYKNMSRQECLFNNIKEITLERGTLDAENVWFSK